MADPKRPPIVMEDLACPLAGCDATLHLTASFGWPIAVDAYENRQPVTTAEMARWAHVNSWQINCEEGHVIEHSEGGDDYANDCDLREIVERLGIQVKRTEL